MRMQPGDLLVQDVGEGRERRRDAGVVGDPAVLQGHVEVHPDEDAFLPQVNVANGLLGHTHAPCTCIFIAVFSEGDVREIAKNIRERPQCVNAPRYPCSHHHPWIRTTVSGGLAPRARAYPRMPKIRVRMFPERWTGDTVGAVTFFTGYTTWSPVFT